MRVRSLILSLAIAAGPAFSEQTVIVGSSARAIGPLQAAPGEVVHLRLQNIKTTFDSTQVAQQLPLPTNFGQLSIAFTQSGTQPAPIPLIRGDALGSGCELLVAVPLDQPGRLVPCPASDSNGYDLTVQIPFELQTNRPGPVQTPDIPTINDATLTVREFGRDAASIRILPVEDRVHLLSQCFGQLYNEPLCTPQVYHADGNIVSAANPARGGEEITVYAYGLGRPDTPVPSGAATPAGGIRVSRPIRVHFPGTGTQSAIPRYVGLTPGQVGLYQINVSVPRLADDFPQCSDLLPSNLTMSVRGTASSDQISFCARP